MSERNRLDAGFAAVILSAESQFGVLIPPALERICRIAYFAGAAEAAALIECHGVEPREISAEYRAAFPGRDDKRTL